MAPTVTETQHSYLTNEVSFLRPKKFQDMLRVVPSLTKVRVAISEDREENITPINELSVTNE